MKTHSLPVLLATALIGLAAPVLAAPATSEATPAELPPSAVACHTLMTKWECETFKTQLSQLNPGPERERLLAEHAIAMQEREAACTCNRKLLDEVTYTQNQQAVLKH